MMASKTSYQFYHEEQLKLLKNKSEKSHNELQKEIGKRWNELSDNDKLPYIYKKKQYEEQLKREAEVLKEFSKQQVLLNKSKPTSSHQSSIDLKNLPQKSQSNPSSVSSLQVINTTKSPRESVIFKNGMEGLRKIQEREFSEKERQTNQTSQNQAQLSSSAIQKVQSQQQQQHQSISQVGASARETNHKVYLEFYARQYEKYRKLYSEREGKELTKVISQEWKLMQLSRKGKSKQRQENPKTEIEEIQQCAKGFILIQGKEVAIPKKPLSGYLRYYLYCYEKINSKLPDLEPNEIAEIVSGSWNTLSDKKKEKYNISFHEESKIYQHQKLSFISKYGFFPSTNSKSTYSKQEEIIPQKRDLSVEDKHSKEEMKNQGVNSDSKSKLQSQSSASIAPPVKLSGYYLFERTLRTQLSQREHNMSARELSAFIGTQWKQFPQASKDEYEAQQEREYQKQKNAYIAKYGSLPEQVKKISGAAAASVASKAAKDAQQTKLQLTSKLSTATKTPKNSTTIATSSALKTPTAAVPVTKPASNSVFAKSAKKEWKQHHLTLEEQEEELERRIARKQQINYDDVESELEDLIDCYSEASESEYCSAAANGEYNSDGSNNNLQRELYQEFEEAANESDHYNHDIEDYDEDNDDENDYQYFQVRSSMGQSEKKFKNNQGESCRVSNSIGNGAQAQFKERNTLFELLNQPIRIPNLQIGKPFF